MSRENIESSLDAVEAALSTLATSLEQAGFAAGADAYQRMADVIIGQRQWAHEHAITEFNGRYQEVGRLATRIYEYLTPYVDVARQLGTLGTLEADPTPPDDRPDEADANVLRNRILDALRTANHPLAATRLGSMVGAGTSVVRRELDALIQRGRVTVDASGGRSLYRVAGKSGEEP